MSETGTGETSPRLNKFAINSPGKKTDPIFQKTRIYGTGPYNHCIFFHIKPFIAG